MVQKRGWLWLVLFALMAAQTMGLMHRVVHHAGAGADGPLAALFSTHDEPTCPLYDQLGHGGMILVPPAVPLPLVPAAFVLQWFQGEVLARWAALFDARGPPAIR